MRTKRRLLILLLCGAMLCSLCSPSAFAEAEAIPDSGQIAGGLCEHHTEHNEDCGCSEGEPCEYFCKECKGETPAPSNEAAIYNIDGSVNITDTDVTIKDCGSTCLGHAITGTSYDNTITVESGTHNITLEDVHIEVSSQSGKAAFSIVDDAAVNLTLDGRNVLKSGAGCAGLDVPQDATLVITEESNGSLDATGGQGGAGIGSGSRYAGDSGAITINGGIVNAEGDGGGAGIGGGGGKGGDGGTIIITGGIVNAISSVSGAGIGGGDEGDGGKITISGGTVNATSKVASIGIGGGDKGTPGTFAADGNAFIVADSISDQTGKVNSSWSGVILEGNDGEMYNSPISLTTDAEIPSGKELTTKGSETLTIDREVTLTITGILHNDGTINVEPGGKLVVGGSSEERARSTMP